MQRRNWLQTLGSYIAVKDEAYKVNSICMLYYIKRFSALLSIGVREWNTVKTLELNIEVDIAAILFFNLTYDIV